MVSGGVPLRDAFSGPQIPVPFAMGTTRDFRDPYYHSWSAGVQRDLGHRLLADVSYVGTRGRNLVVTLDPNQGPAGGPPLRNPAFGPAQFAASVGRSQYDAILARVERRLQRGLAFLASYTWSRSRDHSSSLFGSRASNYAPQNSFDLEAEWAPSDFDTPHRFVVGYVWELPFGDGRTVPEQCRGRSCGPGGMGGLRHREPPERAALHRLLRADRELQRQRQRSRRDRTRPAERRRQPGRRRTRRLERWFDVTAFAPAVGHVRRRRA